LSLSKIFPKIELKPVLEVLLLMPLILYCTYIMLHCWRWSK